MSPITTIEFIGAIGATNSLYEDHPDFDTVSIAEGDNWATELRANFVSCQVTPIVHKITVAVPVIHEARG